MTDLKGISCYFPLVVSALFRCEHTEVSQGVRKKINWDNIVILFNMENVSCLKKV